MTTMGESFATGEVPTHRPGLRVLAPNKGSGLAGVGQTGCFGSVPSELATALS